MTMASLLGACSATAAPSPTQAPSPACGGFHLVVTNHGSTAVDVQLNGIPSTTIAAGADQTIYQYGPGGVSDMPWTVTVVDPATRTVIATRDVTEASGQGAAAIEVDAGSAGAPTVGAVQPAQGC
jgi:hypothetical protein